jgi:hypothetical protein
MITHRVEHRAEYPGAKAWPWDVYSFDCPVCGGHRDCDDKEDAEAFALEHSKVCRGLK